MAVEERDEMTPDRWAEIARVVDGALDLPADARMSFVERSCGGDLDLRREVERLLVACEQAEHTDGFLDQRASAFAAPMLDDLSHASDKLQASVPDVLAAELAGRYTIDGELGRGGMAVVYRARDDRHGRVVAIKVMQAEVSREIGPDRFVREIAIASALQHPHILPVHDSGDAGGHLYYVMPYVDGETLRDRLEREGPCTLEDTLAIARDVGEALDYAHGRGVVHRDIKPANILLDGMSATVADFGVARAIEVAGSERLTISGMAVGTPAYMSPEQATGASRIDGRSDVYSLACVVYEMLAGEPPFTGGTRHALLAKHANATVPALRVLRPSVPASVERAINRALGKVPADRFASAGEFVRALETSASGASESRRRRRRIAAVAATAAAVVLAAVPVVRGVMSPTRAASGTPPAAPLDPTRIAVLYLDDLTPTKELAHVAIGLTEDLIDELSQVRGLAVISPNGVRRYQGKATPVETVAQTLNVGTIVGGSVARSGSRLRVVVRLIDASTGQQLQTRALEQPWTNLFVLQDTLSAQVAGFLRERLGREIRIREQRAGTRSVRAWELVQQAEVNAREAEARIRAGDESGASSLIIRADSLFVLATGLDRSWIVPQLARGRLALARAYLTPAAASRQSGAISASGWILRAIEHVDGALRMRPQAPDALALRGDARYRLVMFDPRAGADTLLALARDDLGAAVALRPDLARAWYTLGELHYREGAFTDAVEAARRALDTDAFLTQIRSVISLLFIASLHVERYDDARTWCRIGLERYPADPRFAECQLTILGWTGRTRRDIAAAWKLVSAIETTDSSGMLTRTWGYRRMMVAAALARSGMRDSARAVLARTRAELSGHSGSSQAPLVEAHVRALLGEADEACRLLAAYLESAPHERAYVGRSPWYRALHRDARFTALVRPSPSPRKPPANPTVSEVVER